MSRMTDLTAKQRREIALAKNPTAPRDQQRVEQRRARRRERRSLRRRRRNRQDGRPMTTTSTPAYADPDHPTPETRLPDGYDDPRSPFWINEGLRAFWAWTDADEADLHAHLGSLRSHGQSDDIVLVPATDAERQRGADAWVPAPAPIGTEHGRALIRHRIAEERAIARRARHLAHERAARAMAGIDVCAVCGDVVPGSGPRDVAGVRRRTVLTVHGQRAVRACGACVLVIERATAEAVETDQLADGTTRRDRARTWIAALAKESTS